MKQKKKAIIITAIIVVFGLIAIGILGIRRGWFLSPKYKVLQAVTNTMEESEFANHVDIAEWMEEGEKSLQGELKLDGIGEAEVHAVLKEEELRVQIPKFGDFVFVYPYQEEKTGFFVEAIGEEKLKRTDEILRFLYDPSEMTQQKEDGWSELKEKWETCEFEVYEGEEKENAEGTVCKAYVTTIPAEQIEEFLPEFTVTEEFQMVFYLADRKIVAVEIRQQEELLWEVELTTSEEKETITISDERDILYELVYEKESEKIKLQTGNYKEDGEKNRFRIQIDGTEVIIDVRNVDLMEWKLSGTFTVSKNETGEKIEGTEIQLGGMEKEDWEALVEKIKEELLKKVLFFL
ncbi:MAG: hypothetical protein ACI4ES_02975 [Roseburia sp.]